MPVFSALTLILVVWYWSAKDMEHPVAGDVVRRLTNDELIVSSKLAAFLTLL